MLITPRKIRVSRICACLFRRWQQERPVQAASIRVIVNYVALHVSRKFNESVLRSCGFASARTVFNRDT